MAIDWKTEYLRLARIVDDFNQLNIHQIVYWLESYKQTLKLMRYYELLERGKRAVYRLISDITLYERSDLTNHLTERTFKTGLLIEGSISNGMLSHYKNYGDGETGRIDFPSDILEYLEVDYYDSSLNILWNS